MSTNLLKKSLLYNIHSYNYNNDIIVAYYKHDIINIITICESWSCTMSYYNILN